MFNHLEGRIVEKGAGRLVLDVGGVGYELAIPFSTSLALPETGTARVFVHLQMSERPPAMKLYGFATEDERALFRSLISVPKIGPGRAVQILSGTRINEFLAAVVSGDAGVISKIKGIGPKTADLVILELKEMAAKRASEREPAAAAEATNIMAAKAGLRELGCSPKDVKRLVEKAIKELQPEAAPQEIIRTALKYL